MLFRSRSLLRLRISPGFGGIILSHEVVPVWFGAETFIGSGSSYSVSPTSTTTYYVRSEGPCGNSSCLNVTVTVQICNSPSNVSATSTTICQGQSTTLSVTPTSPGSGCTWKWYANSCGGSSIGSGTPFLINPTTTTTYYVRAENSLCNPTNCLSIGITVLPSTCSNPSSAVASPSSINCGQTSTLSVFPASPGSGCTWKWYANSC